MTGTIDGGSFGGVLDWLGYSTPRNVKLIAPSASTGFDGTEATIGGGFTNIDSLVGTFAAGNTLTGMNAFANWNLGRDGVLYAIASSTNTLVFAGFTQLIGGGYSDTFNIAGGQDVSLSGGGGAVDFVFEDGANISGTIEGGTGPSTIDWSNDSTPQSVVVVSTGALHGFVGTASSIGGALFSDIDNVIGSAAFNDSLTGRVAGATWLLGGTDTYRSGSKVLTFSSFEQLFGQGLPDPTQTTLSAFNPGGGFVATAQVTATDGFIPQGTVAFYEGSTLLGVVTLQNGQARFPIGNLPPGDFTFTAVYSGDSKHDISVDSIVLHIGL